MCETGSEDCWLNGCEKCSNAKILCQKYSLKESHTVVWYEWRKDKDGCLNKVEQEGLTDDLFQHICSMLPRFLEHCYVKRNQAESYNEERNMVGSHDFDPAFALIQVDFSENYTCTYQDEIQSAHWQQKQVSLFTAAIWFEGKIHPTVLASDNLIHAKETIGPYIDYLLSTLPKSVKTVSLWSDGPSSQFKNKYIVSLIPVLQKKYGITIRWNYFATSHRKGPVDGIGGSVKRQVWTAVNSRNALVNDASSFCSAAKEVSNVNVVHVNSAIINSANSKLNTSKLFEDAPAIKGIKTFHCVLIKDSEPQLFQLTKTAKESPVLVNDNVNDIRVSSWCVVEYDKMLFKAKYKE